MGGGGSAKHCQTSHALPGTPENTSKVGRRGGEERDVDWLDSKMKKVNERARERERERERDLHRNYTRNDSQIAFFEYKNCLHTMLLLDILP